MVELTCLMIALSITMALGALLKNKLQKPIAREKDQTIYGGMYFKRESVLTKHERIFLSELLDATERNIQILIKPRIEDVIGVHRKNRNYRDIQSDRGRIKSRHFDFVLCNDNYTPIAAIELDDPSHKKASAIKADTFKNNLCKSVELRMIRFSSPPMPKATEIRDLLGYTTTTGPGDQSPQRAAR